MKNQACSFATKFILLPLQAQLKIRMTKQDIPSSVNQIKSPPQNHIRFPDPILVILAVVIFSLLVYMAYSMFTFLG